MMSADIKSDVKENSKQTMLDEVLDFVEFIIFSFFILLLIFSFLFRLATVNGSSMYPTFVDGEKIIATHLFYTPQNGDIVLANAYGLNEVIIKRVIATEGQILDIDFENGTVTVDGEVLYEPYINELTRDNKGAYTYPLEIKDGYVFVMGDNRNASTDSRSPYVGMVPEEDILGKVIFRILPFNRIGTVE